MKLTRSEIEDEFRSYISPSCYPRRSYGERERESSGISLLFRSQICLLHISSERVPSLIQESVKEEHLKREARLLIAVQIKCIRTHFINMKNCKHPLSQ